MTRDEKNVAVPVPAQSGSLPAQEYRPKRRWRSGLVGLVIFFCGIVVGVVLTLGGLRRHLLQTVRNPRRMPSVVAAHIEHIYGLDGERTKRVEAILRKHQEDLLDLRRRIQPQVEAHIDSVTREVGAVLGPEAAKSWNKRIGHLRRNWLPPAPGPRK